MKLPKCNGQPQLWSRADFGGLRIIYPNGKVEWWNNNYPSILFIMDTWIEDLACTEASTQEMAVLKCRLYDESEDYDPPEFLGYL